MQAVSGTDIYHCLLSQDLSPFYNQYSGSLLLPGSFSPCGTMADLPRGLILPWIQENISDGKKRELLLHTKNEPGTKYFLNSQGTPQLQPACKGLIIHKTKLHKMQSKELWAFPTKIYVIPGVSVIPSKDQQLSTAAPCISHALRRSCTDYLEQVGVLEGDCMLNNSKELETDL